MRILLGMSGGIDSTYAAVKLMEEGHSVEGAVVVMHKDTETDAAIASCDSLGIPLHVIRAEELFEKQVVEGFVSEYLQGRTPNPCIVCNSDVKFRVLLDYARANGFDKIATGHYASIRKIESCGRVRYALSSARDSKKDQTYMLWRLSQDVLANLCLPLYNLEKASVKEDARVRGILAADREESQEICFIPSGKYAEFIEARTGPSLRGNFIDETGKVVGEHQGIIRYTVGQRKGLGIAMGQRVFVTDIDPDKNTVTLSPSDSYGDTVRAFGMLFSAIDEPKIGAEISLFVKLRYLAPRVPCTLKYLGGGACEIALETPVRAITPGQSAVFYDASGTLVAGGFIASATRNDV